MPGLDNFQYELDVKDGSAVFNFTDPQDASNTASVTLAQKDFPDGINDATDRSVADFAYSKVAKQLNDVRDGRVAKTEADAAAQKAEDDKAAREAAQDFFANSQEVAVAPAKVEKDGTTVYNTDDSTDTNTKKK